MPPVSTSYTRIYLDQSYADALSAIDECVRESYPGLVKAQPTDGPVKVVDSVPDSDAHNYRSDLRSLDIPADVGRFAIANILRMTETEMVSALNGNRNVRGKFMSDIRYALASNSISEDTGREKLSVLKFVLAQSSAVKPEIVGSGSWSCKLVGLDLCGFDFSGIGLRAADFSNANLTGTIFSGSGLVNAKFNGANLSGAKFDDTLLWRAQFIGANLSDADFTAAELSGAEMRNANLQCARLNVKSMPGAKFDGADLSGADFAGGSFTMADFPGAKIENVCKVSSPQVLPQKLDAQNTRRPVQPQKSPITPTSFWGWISGITFRLSSFIRSIPGRIWGSR